MGIKRPLIMDMEPGEEKTMKAMTASSAKLAATCEEVDERSPEANAAKQEAAKKAHHNSKKKRTPITSGGGTPDTQSADNEARRLGQNRMRQAGY
jgi:hypothetical protein